MTTTSLRLLMFLRRHPAPRVGCLLFQNYYGTPNADVMSGVVDPGNNYVYELHQYLDADSSGTLPTCVSETIGIERMWLGWAAWAGGPRWGDNLLSVEPLANGKDRPQLVVIRRHLGEGTVALAEPAQ